MLALPKIAAAAGMLGPAVFGSVLVGLTLHESAYLRSIGWDPLSAPAHDWPSGLALGPDGWIMTATFILSGLLMAGFGWSLRKAYAANRAAQTAAGLLVLAGLALAGLASPTDLTIRTTPATWHGRLHDLSYAALGLTFFPAMLGFGYALRRAPGWRRLTQFTGLVAALAIPSFVLKGIAVYIFLAAVLAWCEAFALRLYISNSG